MPTKKTPQSFLMFWKMKEWRAFGGYAVLRMGFVVRRCHTFFALSCLLFGCTALYYVCCVMYIRHVFPDMPCMKKVYKDKKELRSTDQQPRTKSARGPADRPVVNRSLCFSIGSRTCLAKKKPYKDK